MNPTEQLRWRLLGARPTDTLWGWIGPLTVTVIAGVLRFWDLGRPNTLVFDETYYVKQAYSLLQWGYEKRTNEALDGPDGVFASGTPDVFSSTADFVVHPPLGKWVIAAGEGLFGVTNSYSWRVSVAFLGTLSVLILARTTRRLFGSTLLGTTAGMLLAVEGHHFVHSRTGLLDLILMFFALGGFAALVVDRDRSRELLADRLDVVGSRGGHGSASTPERHGSDNSHTVAEPVPSRLRRFWARIWGWPRRVIAGGDVHDEGPWLGWRPWRWVAAISLGMAVATKWSGLYFVAVFGLMTVLWDAGARRAAGLPCWWRGTIRREVPQGAATVLPVVLIVYLSSWTGWFLSQDGWGRQWAHDNPADGLAVLIPDSVRSLWHYHREMWDFHVGLNAHHVYMSNPWSWMLQARPTSFYYEGPKQGQDGCLVDQCSKAITSLGTVSIWWGATLSLAVLVFMWALRRDWRAGAILAGYVGGYFPWFMFQDRTIYGFYTVAFVPWVVLTVTYVLGLVIGPTHAPPERRRLGLAITGAYVILSIALFTWFWPLYTAQVIPYDQWREWHMWFPSWI